MRAGLALGLLGCLLQGRAVTCSGHDGQHAAPAAPATHGDAPAHREDKSLPDHPAHHEAGTSDNPHIQYSQLEAAHRGDHDHTQQDSPNTNTRELSIHSGMC